MWCEFLRLTAISEWILSLNGINNSGKNPCPNKTIEMDLSASGKWVKVAQWTHCISTISWLQQKGK